MLKRTIINFVLFTLFIDFLVKGDEEFSRSVSINPNETSFQIVRFDTLDIWDDLAIKPVIFNVTRSNMSKQTIAPKTLPPGVPPFNVTYVCTTTQTICNKVRVSFNAALEKIASAIRINTQIRVQAKFYSFCGTTPLSICEDADTLGSARAAARFRARFNSNTQPADYPQALLKQYNTDISLPYNSFDILAEFNTDFNFWYAQDNVTITSDKFDIEYIIAHEITHGLGFASSIAHWGTRLSDFLNVTNEIIAPLPLIYLNAFDELELYSDKTWGLVNPYDLLLYDSSRNSTLQCYLNQLYQFRMPVGTTLNTFYNALVKNKTAMDVIALINNATIGGEKRSISVNSFNNGRYPFIFTSVGFLPGTSLSHLDQKLYTSSSEFLMTPYVGRGKTLSGLIKLYNSTLTPMYGPYGLRTLEILDTIGWPTVLREKQSNMVYIPSLNGIDLNLINSFTGPSGPGINNTCNIQRNSSTSSTVNSTSQSPSPIISPNVTPSPIRSTSPSFSPSLTPTPAPVVSPINSPNITPSPNVTPSPIRSPSPSFSPIVSPIPTIKPSPFVDLPDIPIITTKAFGEGQEYSDTSSTVSLNDSAIPTFTMVSNFNDSSINGSRKVSNAKAIKLDDQRKRHLTWFNIIFVAIFMAI